MAPGGALCPAVHGKPGPRGYIHLRGATISQRNRGLVGGALGNRPDRYAARRDVGGLPGVERTWPLSLAAPDSARKRRGLAGDRVGGGPLSAGLLVTLPTRRL